MFKLPTDVQFILNELQKEGEAIIFGGYIRDTLIGLVPKDIDICTGLPAEKVLSIFLFAQERQTMNGHTVVYFKYKKNFFEIVCNVTNIQKKLENSDLTLNSLGFDGDKLIEVNNALEDIRNKILRYTSKENFIEQLNTNPLLFTKFLRLISKTNFDFDKDTIETLSQYTTSLSSISKSIKNQELYSIIFSTYPVKSLRIMAGMGLISNFSQGEPINPYAHGKNKKTHHFLLTWLALVTSFTAVDELIHLFECPVLIVDNFHRLYEAVVENRELENFQLLNEKLILQNYLNNKKA